MKHKALFILDRWAHDLIYSPQVRQAIGERVDVYAPRQDRDVLHTNPAILRDVQIIFTGWAHPKLDAEFLDAAPALEAAFYGSGSCRAMVSEAMWEREIVVTTATSANSVPVAEFTLAQILFSLKRGWEYATVLRERGECRSHFHVPGAFHSKVGIIALGHVGRLVCEKLKQFDVEVLAYDPHVDSSVFREVGATRASLGEIFDQCDVVSLHAPRNAETIGMINGSHFLRMKPRAVFINTARGALVNEVEMVDALIKRPDLWAILDVFSDDPERTDKRIHTLRNVVLTPHIAGSLNEECLRMGEAMLSELTRYLERKPLRGQVTAERVAVMT